MNLKKIIWAMRAILYKIIFIKFGSFCYVGKPLYVAGLRKVEIGNKVRIFPGLRLEVFGNGAKIIMGNDISIAQNLHIISGGILEIGSKTTISANVFITNVDHEYQEINTHIMQQPLIIQNTHIGENCFLGYGVVIQAGTKLGRQCIVGANSVVRGIFPDYCVIVGAPARVIKKYNLDKKKWEKV